MFLELHLVGLQSALSTYPPKFKYYVKWRIKKKMIEALNYSSMAICCVKAAICHWKSILHNKSVRQLKNSSTKAVK